MEIIVMSRSKMRKVKPDGEGIVIISIQDVLDCIKMELQSGFLDKLQLDFDDVDRGWGRMLPTDADKIARFVYKWKDKARILIVQCEMGICRSAGIAAAISKVLTGDDSRFFDKSRYVPNMLCYRLTLEALYKLGLDKQNKL